MSLAAVPSPSPRVTPGRPTVGFAIFPFTYSYFSLRAGALTSKGLNRSRMPSRAALRCARFDASLAAALFCFLVFCGPKIPPSRNDAFNCLSWGRRHCWIWIADECLEKSPAQICFEFKLLELLLSTPHGHQGGMPRSKADKADKAESLPASSSSSRILPDTEGFAQTYENATLEVTGLTV